jgi:hypothetical protein
MSENITPTSSYSYVDAAKRNAGKQQENPILRDDFYETESAVKYMPEETYDAAAVKQRAQELYPDQPSEAEQYLNENAKPRLFSEKNAKKARLVAGLGDLAMVASEIFGRSRGALVPKRDKSVIGETQKRLEAMRKLKSADMAAWQKGLAESRKRDIATKQQIDKARAKYEADEKKAYDKRTFDINKFNRNADNAAALNKERQDAQDQRNRDNNQTRVAVATINSQKRSSNQPGKIVLEKDGEKLVLPGNKNGEKQTALMSLYLELYKAVTSHSYDIDEYKLPTDAEMQAYIISHWDKVKEAQLYDKYKNQYIDYNN